MKLRLRVGICQSTERENKVRQVGTRLGWTMTSVSLHKARLPQTTPAGMALPLGQKHIKALSSCPQVSTLVIEAKSFLGLTQDYTVTPAELHSVRLTCPGTPSQHHHF